jgi:redox-sensitive bicupin YhaK (pirin superfamily)
MKTTRTEMNIRRADERGQADHGWLKSSHTFSFADYYDLKQTEDSALLLAGNERNPGGAGGNPQ